MARTGAMRAFDEACDDCDAYVRDEFGPAMQVFESEMTEYSDWKEKDRRIRAEMVAVAREGEAGEKSLEELLREYDS
jgi:hypothetical protein